MTATRAQLSTSNFFRRSSRSLPCIVTGACGITGAAHASIGSLPTVPSELFAIDPAASLGLSESVPAVELADAESVPTSGWSWSVTPYVWATDVGVDVHLDGRQVVDERIPVADLIEDIDATFQGRVEARHGRHGFLLDLFYVSMSDSVDSFALPKGAGVGSLDWQLDMTIADLAGTFDTDGDGRGFSLLYGARILDQRMAVDASFTTSSGTSPQQYKANDTLVDALLGVRFDAEITDGLRFQSQFDVSTGGTEMTWSAFPSLAYELGDGLCSLIAGYRHMSIDFADEGGVDAELSLSGPIFGVRFGF